jgi:hypothetical protein
MEFDNEAAKADEENKMFGLPKEQALAIQRAIQDLNESVHKALDDSSEYKSITQPRDMLKAACEKYLKDIA